MVKCASVYGHPSLWRFILDTVYSSLLHNVVLRYFASEILVLASFHVGFCSKFPRIISQSGAS